MTHTETVRRRKRGDGVTKRDGGEKRERERERERKRRRIRRRRWQGKTTNARRENYFQYRKSENKINRSNRNAKRTTFDASLLDFTFSPGIKVAWETNEGSKQKVEVQSMRSRLFPVTQSIGVVSDEQKTTRSIDSYFHLSRVRLIEQLMSCWSLVIQRKRTTVLFFTWREKNRSIYHSFVECGEVWRENISSFSRK